MNKKIIYIIFIIIVTCLVGVILLKINKKQSNEEIPISTENNIDKLKNIDTKDIESSKRFMKPLPCTVSSLM